MEDIFNANVQETNDNDGTHSLCRILVASFWLRRRRRRRDNFTGGGIISGTAVKGPVGGGTVTAYEIKSGPWVLSAANDRYAGTFTMNIGSYTGPVMLQMEEPI
jgi:hypothetical protein